MMNEKVENLILEQIGPFRSELHSLSGELRRLRDEIVDLRADRPSPEARLRELWDAGLESGMAGDVDEVFDRVLRTLNSAGHVM